jgi:hypothetical protein
VAPARARMAPAAGPQSGRLTGTLRAMSFASPPWTRPPSGWANAAIVALAVAGLVDLLYAFLPLTSMWAVRDAAARGGETAGLILVVSTAAYAGLAVVAHLACAGCLAGWLGRMASAARALRGTPWPGPLAAAAYFLPVGNLFLPPLITAAVAGPVRRHRTLVWTWWGSWLGALVALVAGTALSASSELAGMISAAGDGRTVDVGRATGLLGLQIAGRLPGATLCVAAAVLGMLVVHVVTDGFGRLPAAASPGSAQVAGSAHDDRTAAAHPG